MYYNAETDRALRNIEATLEVGRNAMAAHPIVSDASILWDVSQGRWVPNPNK